MSMLMLLLGLAILFAAGVLLGCAVVIWYYEIELREIESLLDSAWLVMLGEDGGKDKR